MAMTEELRKYYENRFDLFATQGWRDLMVDVREMEKATNTLSGVTVDNLHFRQGELSIMRWLLTLREMSEAAYKDLEDEKDV